MKLILKFFTFDLGIKKNRNGNFLNIEMLHFYATLIFKLTKNENKIESRFKH